MTFESLGVAAHLCATLARKGITEPFPVQTATIPDGLAGRDVCGRAPTGSGKTLAFGLVIAASARRGRPGMPKALVLVPTRELAQQVATEISELMPDFGKKSVGVAVVYGGVAYGPQQRAFSRGAGVVVACPGRLEDLMSGGTVDLGAVDLVVVDEADRMADMGFLPAVRRLLDKTSPTRQTMLFSATLDGDVDTLIRDYQRNPARHEIGEPVEDAGEVEHLFWRADASQRVELTAEVVRRHGSTIVFCRTRHGAERIAEQLERQGVPTQALHGGRTQAAREKALSSFARHGRGALVATDVAARGIHVADVACIVHFDPPETAKDYIHRSGRTGRAGAGGMVVSFVTASQRRAALDLQRGAGVRSPIVDPPAIAFRDMPVRDMPVRALPVRALPVRDMPVRAVDIAATEGTERRSRSWSPAGPGARPTRTAVAAVEHERPRRPFDGPRANDGTRHTGTVRFYDNRRGYGFIMQDEGPDAFVHVSDAPDGRELVAGDEISFELVQGDRGLLARKVRWTREESSTPFRARSEARSDARPHARPEARPAGHAAGRSRPGAAERRPFAAPKPRRSSGWA